MSILLDEEAIHPPFPGLLALEARAWVEFAALVPALPWLRSAPRGDGHPVLVLPGWLAGDRSTRPLRWFLRDRGYHAHGWRLGINLGPDHHLIDGLARRFLELRDRHQQKLTLIGWSLGGIYARELARHFASDVRQVITLASPFRDVAATSVGRLSRFGLLRGRSAAGAGRPPLDTPEMRERLRTPPPVPSTAFYSRTDGIVAWQSCLEAEGPGRENVEVWSSHCGMGHHPGVLIAIAERLAQPPGRWRPLRPARAWPT